jgi:hypothetical protein
MQIDQRKLSQKSSMPGAIECTWHHHCSLYRWFIRNYQSFWPFDLWPEISPNPINNFWSHFLDLFYSRVLLCSKVSLSLIITFWDIPEKRLTFERVYLEAFPRYDLLISAMRRECGSLPTGKISTQSVEPFSRYRLLKNFRGQLEVTLWPEISRNPDNNFFHTLPKCPSQ